MSAKQSVEEPNSQGPQGLLSLSAFRAFAPLLGACQGYARTSGCRFRATDFQEGAVDRAKEAAAVVCSFKEELQGGEPALVEEVQHAFHLVMVESVRNAMIATFQRLDMWPPQVSPAGLDADDCTYEDVSAPLPVVAQRLHNDEARRQRQVVGVGGLCRWRQKAMTAAFLVDFASEAGVPLPAMPPTLAMMLEDFNLQVQQWEVQEKAAMELKSRDRSFCGVSSFWANSKLRSETYGSASNLSADLQMSAMTVAAGSILCAAVLHHNMHASRRRSSEMHGHLVKS